MLKWAVTFVVNRLIIFGLIALALSTYFRASCGPGDSLLEQLRKATDGLNEVGRFLR